MGSQKLAELAEQAERNYLAHIEGLPFQNKELVEKAKKLVAEKNLDKRKEYWDQEMKAYQRKDQEFSKLANPYYVGFGNPEADVLFVGKEKAFDPFDSPDHFFQESINNTLHWYKIQRGEEVSEFDPRFPRATTEKFYHDEEIHSHTWGYYAHVIRSAKGLEVSKETLRDERKHWKNSLFGHCFMTEISHRPMNYSDGKEGKLVPKRKTHFNHSFYKSFPVVVMGINDYLGSPAEERKCISEIFGSEIEENEKVELGHYSGGNPIYARAYYSDWQRFIVCYQLSSSTLTNEAKDELGKWMKEGLR